MSEQSMRVLYFAKGRHASSYGGVDVNGEYQSGPSYLAVRTLRAAVFRETEKTVWLCKVPLPVDGSEKHGGHRLDYFASEYNELVKKFGEVRCGDRQCIRLLKGSRKFESNFAESAEEAIELFRHRCASALAVQIKQTLASIRRMQTIGVRIEQSELDRLFRGEGFFRSMLRIGQSRVSVNVRVDENVKVRDERTY